MTAKLEHVAIIAKNPLKTAEWFKKYFNFDYYEGDALKEGMQNTRTIIKNEHGDMLEIFNHGNMMGVEEGAIKHLCFVTDKLDEYYATLLADKQIADTGIIEMLNLRLFFILTFDNVSIELLERA